jgi:hypothetical protein
MVIDAVKVLRCVHQYVATPDFDRLLFVCGRCHRRTELLPLICGAPSGSVVAFPSSQRAASATGSAFRAATHALQA